MQRTEYPPVMPQCDVVSYSRRLISAALIEQIAYIKATFAISNMRECSGEHTDELLDSIR